MRGNFADKIQQIIGRAIDGQSSLAPRWMSRCPGTLGGSSQKSPNDDPPADRRPAHQMLFVRRTHCRTESVNQQGGIKQRVREFLAKKRTAARQACCACVLLDTKRAPVSVQSSTQNVVEIRIYAKCRERELSANVLTREYWYQGVLTGSPFRTRTNDPQVNSGYGETGAQMFTCCISLRILVFTNHLSSTAVNRRPFRGRLKGADRGPASRSGAAADRAGSPPHRASNRVASG